MNINHLRFIGIIRTRVVVSVDLIDEDLVAFVQGNIFGMRKLAAAYVQTETRPSARRLLLSVRPRASKL